MTHGWTDREMASRVAREFGDGSCVNLGVGLPTLVADFIPPDRTIFFHSENGIIGMGPEPRAGEVDPDVVNASKKPATLIQGAAIVHHADSFALIRGGRLDYSVLGGLQVSARGDLANWRVPGTKGVGGVGGAMDLVVGAARVFVMMRQIDKHGRPKLVRQCTYPLTGVACVHAVFTELGVVSFAQDGFVVRELAPGVSESAMRAAIDGPTQFELNRPGIPGVSAA